MANILSNNNIAEAIYLATKDKTGTHLHESLRGVVKFLAKKRFLSKSKDILNNLDQIINKENGVVMVRVSSARKLDEETKTHIKHSLKKRYSAKEIILHETKDENLLGGVRIEAKDEIIDLTARNKINQLQEYLTRPL